MLVKHVIEAIEQIANPRWQAAWDKSGLQVAAAREDVQKIGICLDARPPLLEKAIAEGVDFVLCHHPLSLNPCLPNRLDNWHKALRLLLCPDIPLYACHTSLDVNIQGPAGWLGRELNLSGMAPLENTDSSNEYLGYGACGDLPEAIPGDQLIEQILKYLNISQAFLTGPELPGQIRRVAYCGGSGGSLIEDAAKAGADLYITGDIKHHTALDAEIPVLDVGHHSIEEKMMGAMAQDMAAELEEIEVVFYPSLSPFHLVEL